MRIQLGMVLKGTVRKPVSTNFCNRIFVFERKVHTSVTMGKNLLFSHFISRYLKECPGQSIAVHRGSPLVQPRPTGGPRFTGHGFPSVIHP